MPPASREGTTASEPEPGPCQDAHQALDAYNRRVAGVQASVARAGNQANDAAAEMSQCLYDAECSSDGRRAEALKKNGASASGIPGFLDAAMRDKVKEKVVQAVSDELDSQ